MAQAVVAGLSHRKSMFCTVSVRVRFVVHRVIVGKVFIPAPRFLPSVSFQKCCIDVMRVLKLSQEQAGETWHLKINWLSYIGELRVEEYEYFHSTRVLISP